MSANPVILDVAVAPMLLFNPVVLNMLAVAVGLMILSVVRVKKRRRQEEEERLRSLREPANRNQQDQKP